MIQIAIFDLMEKQGIEQFNSLATDNESEFSNLSFIEKSVPTVQVFFTHAYASWEKEINERHNRMLRGFIPKGVSLQPLSYSYLQEAADTINHGPRKW